jgi:hypothetical protein
MRLVDTVVDECDLDSLAGSGEALPPDRRGTDQSRARVGGLGGRRAGSGAARVVAHGGPDGRARKCTQPRELGSGEDDRDAVERDAVVPADASGRNCHAQPGRERSLGRGERPEVGERGGSAHLERVAFPRGSCERPVPRDLHRERGPRQGDDDLDEIRRGVGRCGLRSPGQQREAPDEGEREQEQ